MKVIFFGSPREVIPILKCLVKSNEVLAVYSKPERPAGRNKNLTKTPVHEAGENLGIRVETPVILNDRHTVKKLTDFNADVFVVAAYGKILPCQILNIPRMGVINIHPSNLPLFRGPSPVASTILEGSSETGISIMLMDEGVDSGPLIYRSPVIPLLGIEKTSSLTGALFRISAEMLPKVLTSFSRGELIPEMQDESLATFTKLLNRNDGHIDWSSPAVYLERMVRAYEPWPGTFTFMYGRNLKILRATVSQGEQSPKKPVGTVSVCDGRIFVACGIGELEILELQLAGSKASVSSSFCNGYPGLNGLILDE